MNRLNNLFNLLIALLLYSCSANDSDGLEDISYLDGLNFYLVEDTNSTNEKLSNHLLESPLIKAENILFYDWSTHLFYFDTYNPMKSFVGKTFVLMNGKKQVLIGRFVADPAAEIEHIVPVVTSYSYSPYTMRFDNVVYENYTNESQRTFFRNALEENGLLREGISMDITDFERVNSTTINYSLHIINNENEGIYVLDPDKMEKKYYRSVTSGAIIYQAPKNYYSSLLGEYPDEGIYPLAWFTRIEPGGEMLRTMHIDDYTDLPTGSVEVSIDYNGRCPEKLDWNAANDGRYWLGFIHFSKDIVMQ